MKYIKTIGFTLLLLALALSGYYYYQKNNPKTIAVVLFDDFTLLDVVGAYQTFSGLIFKNYQFLFVSAKPGVVQAGGGQSLIATHGFNQVKSANILYVPGSGHIGHALANDSLLAWIRSIDQTTAQTTAVGSGTLLLAKAGLLEGREAAAHFYNKVELEALGAKFVNKNYVVSGKYYTGSGTSASIDMVLQLIDDLEGEWQSKATQLFIAYDPAPPVQSGTFEEADTSVLHLAQRMAQESPVDTAREPKTIAMLLYEGFTMLDVTGPFQVFNELKPLGYEMVFVSKTGGRIMSDYLLDLSTTQSFKTLKEADILFIPGGSRTFQAMADSATMAWVTSINGGTQWTTSVCTGSLVLGQAGFLMGRQATSHWYTGSLLEKFGATYSHGRYTKDGKYITGAGVSSGIDLALMVVKELAGENYAKAIQLKLGYHPAPPHDTGSPEKTEQDIVDVLSKMYERSIPKEIPVIGKSSGVKGARVIDPVCKMDVSNGAVDSVTYKGVEYKFCSAGCKKLFESEPDMVLASMKPHVK
ncbi:MAG: DJ-1/PfpI family protein [Cyclobacteriaceae bacterium]